MNQIRQYIAFITLLSFLVIVKVASPLRPHSVVTTPQTPIPTSAPTPLPSPTLTPKPLSLKEMNALYGPCTLTPTLMYHHIQPMDIATKAGHAFLTVTPEAFATQMQYLQDHGYSPITMDQLIAFFDQHSPLPTKSILLTFDDGYEDFHAFAYPILKLHNFHATMFLPTGLVGNSDYLIWPQITEMASSGLINFANHTWSHRSTFSAHDLLLKEITTADTQLSQRGLNASKTFATPYGSPTTNITDILDSLNYRLAFLTTPGRILCARQRFTLPRVRIGNSNLSFFGL